MVTMQSLAVVDGPCIADGVRDPAADTRIARAWDALAGIVDPEIPVVSIHLVDMAAEAQAYVNDLVATRLAPPWTSDWIAPEAKRKLNAFGIVPPHLTAPKIDVAGISPLRRGATAIACPRCGSIRTRLVAQFGSTACKAQYRCDDCAEPFDYFKPY